MPRKKPTSTKQVNIGADGLHNQAGREPETLDIKVVKVGEDVLNNMAALAAKKRAQDAQDSGS